MSAQIESTTERITEDARFNNIDNGERTKEDFFNNHEEDDGVITLDYIPDDYEDDYDEEDYDNEYSGFTNDIDEEVRSNRGGADRAKTQHTGSNGFNSILRNKARGKEERFSFNNQQPRPSFTSPRPPLSPVTTTFWIVSSTPTTTAATTTTTRISINQIDELSSPDEDGVAYDPCTELNACGPNAICTSRGTDPVCSCPFGFSGIPRNGLPDPSHGCVRTPQKVILETYKVNLYALFKKP